MQVFVTSKGKIYHTPSNGTDSLHISHFSVYLTIVIKFSDSEEVPLGQEEIQKSK